MIIISFSFYNFYPFHPPLASSLSATILFFFSSFLLRSDDLFVILYIQKFCLCSVTLFFCTTIHCPPVDLCFLSFFHSSPSLLSLHYHFPIVCALVSFFCVIFISSASPFFFFFFALHTLHVCSFSHFLYPFSPFPFFLSPSPPFISFTPSFSPNSLPSSFKSTVFSPDSFHQSFSSHIPNHLVCSSSHLRPSSFHLLSCSLALFPYSFPLLPHSSFLLPTTVFIPLSYVFLQPPLLCPARVLSSSRSY